jgi:hydrogenase maturation factor HypF (carbamoyltransferase family)
MVRYRLVEEKKLGMTRNREAHELDPEVPRQILAVTDHPNFRLMYREEIEDQIILTILHEHAHLKGVESEAKAEREAERLFVEIEGRYPAIPP